MAEYYLLSVFAQHVGYPKTTIESWVTQGWIASEEVDGRRRIPKAELNRVRRLQQLVRTPNSVRELVSLGCVSDEQLSLNLTAAARELAVTRVRLAAWVNRGLVTATGAGSDQRMGLDELIRVRDLTDSHVEDAAKTVALKVAHGGSPAAVAGQLDCSVPTLRGWVEEGLIQVSPYGSNSWTIPPHEVQRLLGLKQRHGTSKALGAALRRALVT